jgi:hypothetical protein
MEASSPTYIFINALLINLSAFITITVKSFINVGLQLVVVGAWQVKI